ncbi:GMC oxidoreductase [Mycena venus]|uniref:GMC oxidoreductase n=1 Tax=Mycena venus TaxID=2733690 RepID=A0A8H6XJ03_9AGAR|nr:GMC oxidoreductase [Mycena venus]
MAPVHVVHTNSGIKEFDVFIAGSGPIGATYARLLVDQGFNVVMVEIGDQETRQIAAHKKNEIVYQKDIDRFVRVIQGDLSTVSIPPSKAVMPTLDPAAWSDTKGDMSILEGRNPKQLDFNNLPAEAVTRTIGGMTSHWTCATPQFHKDVERPKIFTDDTTDQAEWAALYFAAEILIGTSVKEFDESIRHNVVLNALQKGVSRPRN